MEQPTDAATPTLAQRKAALIATIEATEDTSLVNVLENIIADQHEKPQPWEIEFMEAFDKVRHKMQYYSLEDVKRHFEQKMKQ